MQMPRYSFRLIHLLLCTSCLRVCDTAGEPLRRCAVAGDCSHATTEVLDMLQVSTLTHQRTRPRLRWQDVAGAQLTHVSEELFRTHMLAIPMPNRAKSVILHLAGLEGTGHHYYQAFFKSICKTAETPKCKWPQSWSFGLGGSPEEDAGTFREAIAGLSGAHLLLLDTGSFPQGGGTHDHRMNSHPDELHLVRAAALAGLDALVIVSLRGPTETLVADCVHRRFEPCEMQAQTLIYNAQALASQLQALNPKEFMCATYGDKVSMVKALAWGTGFSQNFTDDLFEETWEPGHANSSEVVHPQVNELAKTMEPAYEQIQRACGP